jgi:hypothetical protein
VDRQQVLKRLDRAWTGLRESYAGLSDSEVMEPGVMGEWSVKDILGHVTTLEEEALKYLPLILRGGAPPRYSAQFGGIDAFNAQMSERKRSLALPEVLRELDEIHAQVVDYVRGAPEEQLATETRFRRRLRLDTYGHYRIHAEAIRDWRQRQRPTL